MPNTTKKNPDADFSSRQSVIRFGANAGKTSRASKRPTVLSFGGRTFTTYDQVPEQIDYRFKKKRLGGKRAAARSRAALTIPFDAEKPIPKF